MNRLNNLSNNFLKKDLLNRNIYYQFINLVENNSKHVNRG